MGFPSPAHDYIESRLSLTGICTTGDSRIIETATGYAVIEPVIKPTPGQVLLILTGTFTQFAKLQGRALITSDGEAIEGEALEEIEVLGHVTYFIHKAFDDDRPV